VVEVVQEHNAIRSQFGLDPLVWDEELARDALRYARILQDWNAGNPGRPVHPGQPTLHETDNPHGENIYWRRATHDSTSMAHAVRQWAGEVSDYNYSTNECSGICGHYTQIVWRNTRKMGCAKVQFGDQTFVVCKYDPPGNIIGRKPY
jgi:pathogenesis-related protein 1